MSNTENGEVKAEKIDWVKIKPAEIENIVIDLHNERNSPAKIGLILRDKYGVPKAKLLGKKVARIIRDCGLSPISEKTVFLKKIESLEKHISKNKHDYTSKRSLTKNLWVIKKLEKTA